MKRKYQIFISSTYGDLKEVREKVTWEILAARHIPAGMESFPATDDRGWRIITKTIDDSDYYVLIIAGRYGTVDSDTGKSWTELEYDYAKKNETPIFAFIREDNSISKAETDTGELADKLNAFTKKVKNAHLYKSWDDPTDLRTKVIQSLNRQIEDDEDDGIPRPGWYRGTDVPSKEVLEELARLSSENADMRQRLSERKGKVAFDLLTEKEESFSDLVITRKRYLITPARRRNSISSPLSPMLYGGTGPDEYLESLNRTVWVKLVVKNIGTEVARNVNLKFTIKGAEKILKHYRYFEKFHLVRSVTNDWTMDPSEHVYIESIKQKDDLFLIKQRFKQINVSECESIVRFGLMTDKYAGLLQFEFDLICNIVNEKGERLEKSFKISSDTHEEKVIDSKSAENLDEEDVAKKQIITIVN